MPIKKCRKCGQWKNLVDFYKQSSAKDGLTARCKECYRRPYDKDKARGYQILRKYSMSAEEYYQLLVAQNYGCAICGYTPKDGEPALSVDHDHSCCPGKISCGKCVRGLLCSRHNAIIGVIESEPHMLSSMLEYIGFSM